MRIIDLLEQYGIPFETEGKNCSPGWIQIRCPFCDDPSFHLGFFCARNYFKCWRCGSHKTVETISRLLKVDFNQAYEIIRTYGGRTTPPSQQIERNKKPFLLPTNIIDLTPTHKRYLQHRGFNPEQLISRWGIKSTGPVSELDGINYRHRILAPISWNGRVVSFQTREVLGRTNARYKACPKDREEIHHKHILYGDQNAWGDTGICVEGITDVWRFGKNSFATFGIEYTVKQVVEMTKWFRRIIVIFDDEPQAQKQAEKLISTLQFSGVKASKVIISGDPGDMEQEKADALIRKIMKGEKV